jgi:hypothetical protein
MEVAFASGSPEGDLKFQSRIFVANLIRMHGVKNDLRLPFRGRGQKKKTDPNPPVWTGLNEKIDI